MRRALRALLGEGARRDARGAAPCYLPGVLPLLRFHVRVGARLAMRLFAAPLSAVLAATLLQDGGLAGLLRALLGSPGAPGPALALAAVALAMASVAAPRVGSSLGGWARHLPVTSRAQRRGAALAVAVSLFPLVLALPLLGACVGAPHPLRWALSLALLALACGQTWLPVRPGAAGLGALAALLAASGTLPSALAAAGALVAADRLAGPLRRPRTRRRRQVGTALLPAAIAVRATRRRLAAAYLAGLLPLAAAAGFVANNDLPPALALRSVRLGGGLGLVLVVSRLAQALATCRPPWPWARSLPWSSRRRVLEDATLLAVAAAPLLALAGLLAPRAALPLVAGLPGLALVVAGAMRQAGPATAVATGPLLGAALAAAAVALQPALAVATALAIPGALRWAAGRERAERVGRWQERHRTAAGDTLAWSDLG